MSLHSELKHTIQQNNCLIKVCFFFFFTHWSQFCLSAYLCTCRTEGCIILGMMSERVVLEFLHTFEDGMYVYTTLVFGWWGVAVDLYLELISDCTHLRPALGT